MKLWTRQVLRDFLNSVLARVKQKREQIRLALRRWRNRLPVPVKRAIRRATRWSLHSLNGVFLAVVLLFVLAHFWLPTLAERKPDIEAMLTSTIGNPVRIEQLDTFWDGLNPGVRIRGLRVGPPGKDAALVHFRELRLSLLWRPLLTGRVAINSLVVVEPSLVVERDTAGQIHVTGVEVAATPETPAPEIGDWILQQREMVIENGTLEWVDRYPAEVPAERIRLQRVNLVLRNDGNRHRFEGRAGFPPGVCGDCRLIADLRGNPVQGRDWSGDVTLRARDLALKALPRIVRQRFPEGTGGLLHVRLDSRWRGGWPESVTGQVIARELVVPTTLQSSPIKVRMIDAALDWRGDRDRGRVDVSRLSLGLTRSAWLSGRARIEYSPGDAKIELEHLNVGDLSAFLAALEQQGPGWEWLRAAKPEGSLDRLSLSVEGSFSQPQDFRFRTTVRGLRFAAHGNIPGFTSVNGRLDVSRNEGQFTLENGVGRVLLPKVFREPIDIQRLESKLLWRREPEHWLVRATDINMLSHDGKIAGSVELRLPFDAEQSPVMKLEADVTNGVVAAAPRYMPIILPDALRRYLEKALVAGQVTRAKIRLQGALRNFPFRDGKGAFSVDARVTHGVYAFLPGWEPIRNVEADLHFSGTSMEITGTQGTLRDLRVGRVTVAIDDFQAPAGAMIIAGGRIRGTLSNALEVLADSQASWFKPYVIDGLRTTGDGVLTLDLQIPARQPTHPRIDGLYVLAGNSVELPFRSIRFDNLQGHLGFSESGLQTGRLSGRLLGGDFQLQATPGTDKTPGTVVDLSGKITQDGINQVLGETLASRVRGTLPWKGQWWLGRPQVAWQWNANLEDLEVRFPAPLAKRQGESLAMAVRTLPASSPNQQVIDLQIDDRVTGRLALKQEAGHWQFERGHLAVGERVSKLPDSSGLQISGRMPSLNVDKWWALAKATTNEGGSASWLDDIRRLRVETGALELFGRPFGRMLLDFDKQSGKWRGSLLGDAATGQVLYFPHGCSSLGECLVSPARAKRSADPRPAIGLVLDHLVLPPARKQEEATKVDPRSLPVLSVQCNALTVEGIPLGALDLLAEPVRQGWQIKQANFKTPETQVNAKGLWEVDWQGEQNTSFDVDMTSSDFGRTLDQLGYAGELDKGKLDIHSKWRWSGSPADWSLGRSEGQLELVLTDGRLLQISPGAGRILGVLDLRSLTRYLSLDLSTIFGKGMTFDSIKGNVEITSGSAYSRQLLVKAPGADMEISGRVGLVARDLDLELGVTPRLVEELTIGGTLLGGPAVGAAVALLHNLAKKPLEKNTQIKYTVKGSWEQPDVQRIGGPELPPEEPNP